MGRRDIPMGIRAWWTASRPLAQANIAAPLLLGQALAWAESGRFSWRILVLVAAFGIADQLFIVYANDYADRHDDDDSRTPFSGGSGVLQNGFLRPESLRRGAVIAAFATVALGAVLSFACFWVFPLALLAVMLLLAYSYPPLRLSYRGGGEWLQGIGVGGVLPLVGYGSQAGTLSTFPFLLLGGTVLFAAAGNVATALPDLNTDRRAGKRTWPVRFGQGRAQAMALVLSLVAIAIFASAAERPILGLASLALAPWFVPARTRAHVLLLVFSHGLAMQGLYLGLACLLLRG